MGEQSGKSSVGIIYVIVSVLLSVWFGFFFISLVSECVLEKNPFEGGCIDVAEDAATVRAQKFVEKIFSIEIDTTDEIKDFSFETVKFES